MNSSPKHLIVIHGPTAVGKTKSAIEVAKEFDSDIISADSRQIYKELQIGVAKPSIEELKEVRHHFINHISIQDYYSAGLFEKEILSFLEAYYKNKNIAILTGGTGLYIKAALEGFDELPIIPESIKKAYQNQFELEGIEHLQKHLKKIDPKAFEQIDIQNPYRLIRAICLIEVSNKPLADIRTGKKTKRAFISHQIILAKERAVLYDDINKRVDHMITNGLIEEATQFHKDASLQALQTVGYKEVFDYLDGKSDRDEMIELIKQNTRRYAKRQLTWLRKIEAPTFHPNHTEEIIQYLHKQIKMYSDE